MQEIMVPAGAKIRKETLNDLNRLAKEKRWTLSQYIRIVLEDHIHAIGRRKK